jgi:putative ABC transport system substrate-binding protein
MNRRDTIVALLALSSGSFSVRSQQPGRKYQIGTLSSNLGPSANTRAFRERLQELGWIEGRNLTTVVRFTGADRARISAAAKELSDLKVDVIVTAGGAETAQAAITATKKIPIVFVIADDPVRVGLVRNLSHPEGNITGFSSMNAELDAKRLGILKEILPGLKRVGVVWSPVDPSGSSVMSAAEGPATSLGIMLDPLPTPGPEDLGAAFDLAKNRGDNAVMILATPILFDQDQKIAKLAMSKRLPTISAWRQLPEAGGLISYGPNTREMFRRAAAVVNRILKGARPSEIPVERPTRFDLTINLNSAKALGIKIPQSVLIRADRVIE